MKKMVNLVAMTLLCGTTATAGMSHKVLKNPPAQVFEAAVRVGRAPSVPGVAPTIFG